MGKRQLCIYADDNLISIAKAKGWNLSELFNNMLRGMCENEYEEIKKVSIDDLNKKELDLQNEINKIKSAKLQIEKQKGRTIEIEYQGD